MRILLFIILLLPLTVTAQSVNRTFNRDICIQRYENGVAVETHVRRSRFTHRDDGKLIETVLVKTPNVKGVSDKDIRDFIRKPRPRLHILMLSHDYGFKEYEVNVVVKETFDDPPEAVRRKERRLLCQS